MQRRRPRTAGAIAFAKALETKKPNSSAELEALAKAHRVSRRDAREIAKEKDIRFREQNLLGIDAAKPQKAALARKVLRVFAKYEKLFIAMSKKYARMGIPFDFLWDNCIDSSMRAAVKYKQGKGTAFSTWIITGWERLQLPRAMRKWNELAGRTKQLSRLENPEGDSSRHKKEIAVSREPESWISYAKAEERQRIRAALKTLSENERQVIIHRFGLAGAPLTLLQTGRILRMSYENVRLIEKRALPKLRKALTE